MVETPLVIYHANCHDGFCAAWLIWRHLWPHAEFKPMYYNQPLEGDIHNRDIIIADFSFDRETLETIKDLSWTLRVFDHHKTAQAALKDFPNTRFDLEHSGAFLVWDYLSDRGLVTERPWLVDYTEDRDLWLWKLPSSKTINAALRSYPFDFGIWDALDRTPLLELHNEGVSILRAQNQIVSDHVKNAREATIADHKVLTVNATCFFSEIAGELAQDRPFGLAWFRRQDGQYQYSLRSRGDGVDVSEIAKSFGGGGHKQAAGFETDELLAALK